MITLDPNKRLYITDPKNRDYITSVKCISSTSEAIPPLLILLGLNILYKWCQHNNLDKDTVIGKSKTGYLNYDLAIDWLHHFIYHTKILEQVLEFC